MVVIEGALERLKEFSEGALILEGDWNMVQDPTIDFTSNAPHFLSSLKRA